MDPESREGANLPISGGILILALLFGALFFQPQAFKGSRPQVLEEETRFQPDQERVRARLWEDPFEAVERHLKKKRTGDEPLFSGGSDTSPLNGNSPESLSEQINEKGKVAGEVVILGVMVFGGPYVEPIEARTRNRHAVLSALGERDYVPEDPEHIGFMEIPPDNNLPLPEFVPYEWFAPEQNADSEEKKAPVLLLWLNDGAFFPNPLAKIAKLKKLLTEPVGGKSFSYKVAFKILGPAGSTNLRAMLTEDISNPPKGVEFLSPFATADERELSPAGASGKSVGAAIEEKLPDGKFLRTIGTDNMLTDALVEELARRGIGCDSHIVLISEWDTFYGRALPRTFVRSARKYFGHSYFQEGSAGTIHKYSYLRGIDGQIPGQPDPGENQNTRKVDNDQKEAAIERPVGRSQFDYLRRISSKLKYLSDELQRDGRGRIEAIGVLGSDVYDKLLVLQALRPQFANTIFFTTDLDARLLHPEEKEWTRNLIIASNYGLELHPDLQGRAPPFRDNYQTSLFFSTLLAFAEDGRYLTRENLQRWLQPRVFEVGKSGAFDLLADKEDSRAPEILADLGVLRSVHPLFTKPSPFRTPVLAAIALLLLFVLFLCFYRPLQKAKALPWPELALIAYVVLSAFALRGLVCVQQDGGEPFALFEGISIWPAEYLRLWAGGLALYFLYKGNRRSRESEKRLAEEFFSPSPKSNDENNAKSCPDSAHSCNDAVCLWDIYSQAGTPKKRWLYRVIPLSLIYFALAYWVIMLWGEPFVPYRGIFSMVADKVIIIGFGVIPLIVLIFWVVDATRLSVGLIDSLSEKETLWPPAAVRHCREKFGMDPQFANEWLDIQVIAKHSEAVGRFIYYPFVVIFLLIISRGSYFDNWDLPKGLLIVILASLSYAVYCAIMLRHAAEKARRKALEQLREKQIRFVAEGEGSKVSSELIALMLESIRSNQQGAFRPVTRQPWVRALMLFFGGGGSLIFLQYLAWFK